MDVARPIAQPADPALSQLGARAPRRRLLETATVHPSKRRAGRALDEHLRRWGRYHSRAVGRKRHERRRVIDVSAGTAALPAAKETV